MPDCNGIPCEEQQPHMIVSVSPPPPTPWALHDKILWGADVVLAILGYAGIMMALATLRKIERHTEAFEDSIAAVEATAKVAASTAEIASAGAGAALDTARAALLQTRAMLQAERPWILVTAEPTQGAESSFQITATNRGRSPARITAALDQVLFATDEAHLPEVPELKPLESGKRFVPIILLPGESATLKTFSREDARGFCDSEEMFKSIESWDQRLFLVGKVSYSDLITTADRNGHESTWCSWYIHGKQRSALVPAGGAAYNAHT